jgi:His/Glu/Gln/Arg/opine family amino acid ABC transporter permease subunit
MTLAQWLNLLVKGAIITIALTAATLLSSTLLAIPTALGRRGPLLTALPAGIYTWISRGIPEMVIIFFAFFGLPTWGIKVSPIYVAIIAFTSYNTAYFSEIFRAGLASVPRRQREAALALGLSPSRTLWRVIVPQAVPIMIPPYISQATEVVKGTALASVIGVPDLTGNARAVSALINRPFAVLGAAALIYLVLNSILLGLQFVTERRRPARR